MTTTWFHSATPGPTRPAGEESSPVHISVVLDRSGSMGGIADDIVGGFNQFLDDQREQEGEARVTLAQFDSHDPFEVLINAVDLRRVADLDRSAYQPRGMTPLYDAVGRMIRRIDRRIAKRARQGLPEADQVVAIVTDGLENASRRYSSRSVFKMIDQRRKDGWVFVFLGANQDSYATGRTVAVAPANRRDWEASSAGTRKMWRDLSHSSSVHRAKPRAERLRDRDVFYEEDPQGK